MTDHITTTGIDAGSEARVRGALLGLFLGDALAMPVHWYYDRAALHRDYGRVVEMVAPREPHPDSILWRSAYTPTSPETDILQERAAHWGRRGAHYHRNLDAGENTLTAELARLTLTSIHENRGYDPTDWLRRYIALMTTPRAHRDTYLEECHRGFFANLGRGRRPERCAVVEKHVGGLVGLVPVVVWHREDTERALQTARTHVGLTHGGARMAEATALIADILLATLRGEGLRSVIEDRISRQASEFVGHPFSRWQGEPDEVVIGRRLSPACYIEDAVPAILHLALRYHADPEAGLVTNTNLGGDNVHRGAVLGALLGAENGEAAWPRRWREGLKDPVPAAGPSEP